MPVNTSPHCVEMAWTILTGLLLLLTGFASSQLATMGELTLANVSIVLLMDRFVSSNMSLTVVSTSSRDTVTVLFPIHHFWNGQVYSWKYLPKPILILRTALNSQRKDGWATLFTAPVDWTLYASNKARKQYYIHDDTVYMYYWTSQ